MLPNDTHIPHGKVGDEAIINGRFIILLALVTEIPSPKDITINIQINANGFRVLLWFRIKPEEAESPAITVGAPLHAPRRKKLQSPHSRKKQCPKEEEATTTPATMASETVAPAPPLEATETAAAVKQEQDPTIESSPRMEPPKRSSTSTTTETKKHYNMASSNRKVGKSRIDKDVAKNDTIGNMETLAESIITHSHTQRSPWRYTQQQQITHPILVASCQG